MIVVINPSAGAGRSFKGLHAYCAHDPERAQTAERVEWIDSRNIATDDPEQGWKVMVATAQAQNDLKKAAGIRAGRAAKHGPVMHVVLSFDQDEPSDRETMQAAADELLSKLGADPAKMRGKAAPKRRQFADEHQVMMYAHTDTKHRHLHLMINRVHPETGLNLPSSNDQLKAQKWALDFSKRHGTDHKTPAREENKQARDQGEYVKGNRRKSRNLYELEQALEVSNDNDRLKTFKDEQRKKDAALALRGRNMAALHRAQRDKLAEGHRQRTAALARQLTREIGKAKAEAREEFRQPGRDLKTRQAAERQTFEALESSFFGRLVSAARLSASMVRDQETAIIKRTFGVIRNAAERKAYFYRAQERARSALERQQTAKVSEATARLKDDHSARMETARDVYAKERAELAKSQAVDRRALSQAWKTRTAEREAQFREFADLEAKRVARDKAAPRETALDPREAAILASFTKEEFEQARRSPAREQEIKRDRDDEQER